MKVFSHVFLCIFFAFISHGVVADEDFIDEVKAKADSYRTIVRGDIADELRLVGSMYKLNDMLTSKLENSDKTAADYFIVANMMFSSNREKSYRYIMHAYRLMPDEPKIIYEAALHEHRKGNHSQASVLYEKYQNTYSGSNHAASYALIADCYLRLGEHEKAVDAWIDAKHGKHHISIEKAIYVIYGNDNPTYKRSLYHKKIRAGDDKQYGNLIKQDIHWNTDWWNGKVNEKLLQYDLNIAREEFGNDDLRYKELLLLADILKNTPISDEDFFMRLNTLGVWGKQSRLPYFPVSTYYFIQRLTQSKSVTVKQLLEKYEVELRDRVFSVNPSKREVDILAFFYDAIRTKKISDAEVEIWNRKLKKLDLYGWEKLHLAKYAQSFVFGMNKKDEDYKERLIQAAKEFPNSTTLVYEAFNQNLNSDKRADYMASVVAAEYPNVKVEQNSNKLKNYIYSFAKEIGHSVADE